MKNWFGMEPHITDTYIHWTVKDKDIVPMATKLREAYDAFESAGMKKELDILLEAAYESGVDDENDSNAGAEI